MQTRYDKNREIPGVLPSGYEGSNVPNNFTLPSCGIEDVDRAFFELFDKVLPFSYKASKDDNERRKIPVVFATGERFALASKKSPLRDRNNALILPIISISRSGVEQESTKGVGVSDRFNEMVIRKRITTEDSLYQALQNTQGFRNSPSEGEGSTANLNRDYYTETGRLLNPDLKRGLYEVLVIPMPKYFTLKYEVTFWTQYVGHLNEMITTLMGAYIQPGNRTIKITTKKGYWFVAYFETSIGSGNNFDGFNDEERVVKATITAEVPGYLILPEVNGIPNGIRSYISAPTISFGAYIGDSENTQETPVNSGKVDTYILSEVATEDTERPSGVVGENGKSQAESQAGADRADASRVLRDVRPSGSAVGNTDSVKTRTRRVVYDVDPVTGKRGRVVGHVVDSNPRKGEEVIAISDFAKL
jgi:hypothetical protein